jgi:hypothetical protein
MSLVGGVSVPPRNLGQRGHFSAQVTAPNMTGDAGQLPANGQIGPFGRTLRSASSIPPGSDADIAWKVAFRGRTLSGGKPNGECRLRDLNPAKWHADRPGMDNIPPNILSRIDH